MFETALAMEEAARCPEGGLPRGSLPFCWRDGAVLAEPFVIGERSSTELAQRVEREQAASAIPDARADLYALGVILYRALTGVLPFEADSAAEVMRMHQSSAVVPPRRRTTTHRIPEAAEDLCLWLLAKDPKPACRALRCSASRSPPIAGPDREHREGLVA